MTSVFSIKHRVLLLMGYPRKWFVSMGEDMRNVHVSYGKMKLLERNVALTLLVRSHISPPDLLFRNGPMAVCVLKVFIKDVQP